MKWKAIRSCKNCDGNGYFVNPFDQQYRCECYKKTRKYKNRNVMKKTDEVQKIIENGIIEMGNSLKEGKTEDEIEFIEDGKAFTFNISPYSKKIASAIRTYISGCLPASNRKSCDISEHYVSRYKEGWNAYRAELIKRIFNDKNV